MANSATSCGDAIVDTLWFTDRQWKAVSIC